jgi:phasin family protein
MYDEIIDKTGARFNELLTPARKFNAVLIENLEKLAGFQLEAARSYSELGLNQLRSALEITDAQSLQAFISNQSKVVETFGQRVAEDANTLANLSKDFGAELQKLAQENVVVLGQAAQDAQPKVAAAKPQARKSA